MTKEEKNKIIEFATNVRNDYVTDMRKQIAKEEGKIIGADYMLQRLYNLPTWKGEKERDIEEIEEVINCDAADAEAKCRMISDILTGKPHYFEEPQKDREELTYGDVYDEFCKKFPNVEVEDYRPAITVFEPQISDAIPYAIVVWLKDGSRVIYTAESDGRNVESEPQKVRNKLAGVEF